MATSYSEHLERVREERVAAFDRLGGQIRQAYLQAASVQASTDGLATITIHIGERVSDDLKLLVRATRGKAVAGDEVRRLFGFPVFVDLDDPDGMEVRATWVVS